jgi:hypothetical protein
MQEQYKIIKNTLNLYAVFGYILPGFFLVFLFKFDNYLNSKDYNIFNQEITNFEFLNQSLDFIKDKSSESPNFAWFIVLLFLFYILGHFVSAFSSFVFERILVKKILGYPAKNLLEIEKNKKKQKCKIFAILKNTVHWLFNNNLKSMDNILVSNIKNRVNILYNKDTSGNNLQNKINLEEYYWICYTYIINHKPYLSERIHHFVNLYGFTRNIAGTILFLIISKLLYFIVNLNEYLDSFSFVKNKYFYVYNIIIFIIFILMFWSYLKLFRRQALDVYLLFLTVFDEVDFIRTQSQNTNEKNIIND